MRGLAGRDPGDPRVGSTLSCCCATSAAPRVEIERETQWTRRASATCSKRIERLVARPAPRPALGDGPFSTKRETWRRGRRYLPVREPGLMAVLRADSNWEMGASRQAGPAQCCPRRAAATPRSTANRGGSVHHGRRPRRLGLQVRASATRPTRARVRRLESRELVDRVVHDRAPDFGLAVRGRGTRDLHPRDGEPTALNAPPSKTTTIAVPTGDPGARDLAGFGAARPLAERGPAIALATACSCRR